MIRKLKNGRYRLYSRKKNPKTGKRRNLGTFETKAAAKKHEKLCSILSGIRNAIRRVGRASLFCRLD